MPDSYLTYLLDTGRVRAASSGADAAAAVAELPAAIQAADAVARLELPGTPPALSMPAAVWAATLFYHACRFLVYRDIGPDVVSTTMAARCPESPSPSVVYSVDLTFRYLPDLTALARGIAEDDPLVESLYALARAWPMSSVGIPLATTVDISAFIQDNCLRTLYCDRILLRKDQSRMKHPTIEQAMKEAIGLHPELASGAPTRTG
jgi:hypothetical protein